MKQFVIDTNVVFSAAMHPNSDIGRYIASADLEEVLFFAPVFLQDEIERHIPKLVRLAGQEETTVREIIQLAYKKIVFISTTQIPIAVFAKAARLVRDVDPYDLEFVALSIFMEIPFWTGDMKLYRHLVQQGFTNVFTFAEVRTK